MLCEQPLLAYFDIDKPITLSVDASSEGTACVLFQEDRLVVYGPRALTETERRYGQIERECLAILHGCLKFDQYLYGQTFVVDIDHQSLVFIFEKPLNKCPPRLHIMKISLQIYDFKVVWKPGKELVVADHLSRTYLRETSPEEGENIEAFVRMILGNTDFTDERLDKLVKQTKIDEELNVVLEYMDKGGLKIRILFILSSLNFLLKMSSMKLGV